MPAKPLYLRLIQAEWVIKSYTVQSHHTANNETDDNDCYTYKFYNAILKTKQCCSSCSSNVI